MPANQVSRWIKKTLGLETALSRTPRGAHRPPQTRRCRLSLERLEDRTLPSTVTVLNTNDSGPDSLRQAMLGASPGDTILFQQGLTGTIALSSTLAITENLTIEGPGSGALTISGQNTIQDFSVSNGVSATISGVSIANGYAAVGGGIFNAGNLVVNDCAISGNSAVIGGGGILNDGAYNAVTGRLNGYSALPTLTLIDSDISSNTAQAGGGVFNNGGTMTVSNSTFSDNSANTGNHASGTGGGIFNAYGGTMTVSNSTLSGNSANGDGGGAIFNSNGTTLTVSDSTLSGNSGGSYGGGIYNNGGTLNLTNTIVANSPSGEDLFSTGAIASAQYNLIQSAAGNGIQNGVDGNIVGTDPLLSPLGNYGGPTQTFALLPGSPAIDAGSDSLALDANGNPLTTDQRGLPRIGAPQWTSAPSSRRGRSP